MLEWIHNIDAQILLFIQQYLRSDLFTWLWKGITFLGDGGWFWMLSPIILMFPSLNLREVGEMQERPEPDRS